MGLFRSETELYDFFAWLEYVVAPAKGIPPKEAHKKAHAFVFQLRIGRACFSAIACLDAFRLSQQNKDLAQQ